MSMNLIINPVAFTHNNKVSWSLKPGTVFPIETERFSKASFPKGPTLIGIEHSIMSSAQNSHSSKTAFWTLLGILLGFVVCRGSLTYEFNIMNAETKLNLSNNPLLAMNFSGCGILLHSHNDSEKCYVVFLAYSLMIWELRVTLAGLIHMLSACFFNSQVFNFWFFLIFWTLDRLIQSELPHDWSNFQLFRLLDMRYLSWLMLRKLLCQ